MTPPPPKDREADDGAASAPDDDPIARMFTAHAQPLLLYARQWVDAAAADDVVQHVFVRLIASGRLPDEPRTWLYRCVRNEAISASRSRRRRARRERSVAATASSWFAPTPGDRLDARSAQAALEKLPLPQREVVALRLWSALSLTEIAKITGLAVSTIHNHYHSALTHIRQQLESPCPRTNP